MDTQPGKKPRQVVAAVICSGSVPTRIPERLETYTYRAGLLRKKSRPRIPHGCAQSTPLAGWIQVGAAVESGYLFEGTGAFIVGLAGSRFGPT